MRWHRESLIVASSLFLAGCSVQLTGVYSSMHIVGNGANIQGIELQIVRGDNSDYFAVLQCADRRPGKPVVMPATIVAEEVEIAPIRDAGNHCPKATFRGRIGPSGIVGAFVGSPEVTLDRTDSFWQ